MIRPLPGFVLVEPIKDDSKVKGVYLPDDIDEKPSKGKVIAVGDDLKGRPFTLDGENYTVIGALVKKGETVIYKKWTNQEVHHEGKTYLMIKFEDLMGVIE